MIPLLGGLAIAIGLLLYYHVIVITTTVAVILGYIFGSVVVLIVVAEVASWVWTEFFDKGNGDQNG